MAIGYSFSPNQPQAQPQPAGNPAPNASPQQTAIQLLSFKLPQMLGAGSISPLVGQGPAGALPFGVDPFDILKKLGMGPMATPTPPLGPTAPPNPFYPQGVPTSAPAPSTPSPVGQIPPPVITPGTPPGIPPVTLPAPPVINKPGGPVTNLPGPIGTFPGPKTL